MKRITKITLTVIAISMIFIVGIGFYIIDTIGDAFGADCEYHDSWTVQEYEIDKYRCVGWAGPPYFPLYIKKDGRKLPGIGTRKDSCTIGYEFHRQSYVELNTCDGTINEILPIKEELLVSKIDSILMLSSDNSSQSIKLTEKNLQKFVEDWNKSDVFDYRSKHPDSMFYPNYQYKFIVFENGSLRHFTTAKSMIADDSNWVYSIGKSLKENYFGKYME